MCKQNSWVINSIWTWQQRFLHTGVQRFLWNPTPCTTFWKSRGKLTKKSERNRRERRLLHRPRQKYKAEKKKRHTRTTYDAHQLNQARITASSKHAEETTFKKRRFQNNRNADRNRTSTSAFKKRQPEQRRNRRRQPDQSRGSEKTKPNRIL